MCMLVRKGSGARQRGHSNLAPGGVVTEGFLSAWKWCGLTTCSCSTTALPGPCPCPDAIDKVSIIRRVKESKGE